MALLGCSALNAAPATQPAADEALRALQPLVPETERTQLMVLGTMHLYTLGKRFEPAMVRSTVEALLRFKPEVVAIEVLGGERLREMQAQRGLTSLDDELFESFAGAITRIGQQAQALLQLDDLAARKALRQLGPDTSALTRMLHELAALELYSGVLQWSRLRDDAALRAQVPAALAQALDKQLTQANEVVQLALPVARASGLQRLEAIDDFEHMPSIEPVFEPLQAALKNVPLYQQRLAELQALGRRQQEEVLRDGALLPTLRRLNTAAAGRADIEAQWALMLQTRLPSLGDRARLALWEERNLKIAAKLRALTARHPSKRVLVIYGSAHKPYLDAYLSTASDVKLVDPLSVLGEADSEKRP